LSRCEKRVRLIRMITVGRVLRAERRRSGLTLRQLAEKCGTDHTHLSRIESSDDRVPSRDLLDRMGAALGPVAAARLSSSAGRLTPGAERMLSAFAEVMAEPAITDRVQPALRRVEARLRADSILAQVRGRASSGDRVDAWALCRALGLRPEIRNGSGPAASFTGNLVAIRDPGGSEDAGAAARVNFLLAHAVAHFARNELECSFPRASASELPALDTAACLLCPHNLLDRAFRNVMSALDEDARNPWTAASGEVVAAVADRLAVPGWVALRCLADEQLLDDDAIYYSLGDRP
jgi:transcriptional regulator with XRE-family HTH domain